MTSLLKKNAASAAVLVAVVGLFAQTMVAKAGSDFEIVSFVPGPDPVTQPESFTTDSNGFLWLTEAYNETFGL